MLSLPSTPTAILFPLCAILIFQTINSKAAAPPSPPPGAQCHPDDEAGLLAFKSGIKSDPTGMLQSWIPATNCCIWYGITCRINNRVTAIMLNGQPNEPNSILSGTISPSLSKLQYLDGIYFIHLRELSGTFPNFLFSLPNLLFIYLDNNKFSGPIPEHIGNMTQLQALSLEGNKFSGTIPSSVGQLTQLIIQLRLGQNLLIGTIPLDIQNLTKLTELYLDQNKLTGTIPDFFTAFNNLGSLNLTGNKFTGEIPQSISSLAPVMGSLELSHNLLTGRIPDFLGNFQDLFVLDLSWNNFSGVLPKTFSNLTGLSDLDLSHNQLVDPFPSMNVTGIHSIDLSYNQFHLVNIPSWVTSSSVISSLKLVKCGIKIKLDDWKPPETGFYDYIDLSDNEIMGSQINLLKRTQSLEGFIASGNKLQFNLESMKFPKTLKYLDLSRNLVTGTVPDAVSRLEKLNVSHNHLCGLLPNTKFPARAFAGNDCLCGHPLPACTKV